MERYDFKTQRLFVSEDLVAGKALNADRNQANYLLNVLRMKEGSKILLFNGRDGEWLAEVHPQGRKACTLVPVKQTRAQPDPYDLMYCFAPLKQARLDYMIQKAVEMGAGVLQPVATHHTQVSKLNTERMRSNAIEAAEQCGILSIPHCEEIQRLPALLETWDAQRILIFADESANPEGSAGANPLTSLKSIRGKSLALLIGPEGGFSAGERELLLSKDYVVPISLGPRILRADTAAVAAMAILQAVIGDWYDG